MPGFLEIARQKAVELNVSPRFIQMDMRQIEFDQEFDRILLLFTSFGYFEDRENLLVLEKVVRALKPGGLLIFETFVRQDPVRPHPEYYLEPGELRAAFSDFTIYHYQERALTGRSGTSKMAAQLVARKR